MLLFLIASISTFFFISKRERRKNIPLKLQDLVYLDPRSPTSSITWSAYVTRIFHLEKCGDKEIEAIKKAFFKIARIRPFIISTLKNNEIVPIKNFDYDSLPFIVTTYEDKNDRIAKLESKHLTLFGHFYTAKQLINENAPLLTLKITKLSDGSGCLSLNVSHTLFDGNSSWNFIRDLAAATRGEKIFPVPYNRDVLGGLVFNDKEAIEEGLPIQKSQEHSLKSMFDSNVETPFQSYSETFLNGTNFLNRRPSTILTNTCFTKMKDLASPVHETKDNWVSTQDSFLSHLVFIIAKKINYEKKFVILLWLESRKYLNLDKTHVLGSGYAIMPLHIGQITSEMSVQDIAALISKQSKLIDRAKVIKAIKTANTLYRNDCEYFVTNRMLAESTDIIIKLNNQSKQSMPVFGHDIGVPKSVISQAGPNVILPFEKNQVQIFWDESIIDLLTLEELNSFFRRIDV